MAEPTDDAKAGAQAIMRAMRSPERAEHQRTEWTLALYLAAACIAAVDGRRAETVPGALWAEASRNFRGGQGE